VSSLERALVRSVRWLVAGLVAALPLLAVPTSDHLFAVTTIHLSMLVALGLAVAWALTPLADDTWFAGTRLSVEWRLQVSAAGVVALATGVVGLVTLASSAALRLQPSLQFLQLLSALDIAWAGAAIVVGLRRWHGRGAAAGGGLALGVVCVWSIWRYLDQVGFTADGGWQVDGGRLMALVIPYDMAAATVAVAVLVVGTRRAHRTAQPSPQS
jgi:hypothetical protein